MEEIMEEGVMECRRRRAEERRKKMAGNFLNFYDVHSPRGSFCSLWSRV